MIHAECATPEIAADIVAAHEKAMLFDALVQNDWCILRQDDTHYKCIYPGWHEDIDTKGSGSSAIEAVRDALRGAK